MNLFHFQFKSRKVALAAVCAAFALGGCAQPYVKLQQPAPNKEYRAQTLAEGMEFARMSHRIYRDKVIELGESERSLSNALVGVGALTFAAALAKVHASAIAGTAAIGGAGYTLGTFNTDKRRPIIYIAGMKAFECAIDAVSPLNLPTDVLQAIPKRREKMQEASTKVAGEIGKVVTATQVAEQAGNPKEVIAAVRTALVEAEAAIVRARQVGGAADKVITRQAQAGEALSNAITKIDTMVLDQLRGIEVALQAVPDIIKTLVANNDIFAALGKPAPAPAASTKNDALMGGGRAGDAQASSRGALASALGALRAAVVALDTDTESLHNLIKSVDEGTPIETLKACKVENVKTAISASESVLRFTAGKADKQTVFVDGGSGNLTASILNDPAGLSAKFPPRSNGIVEVIATDKVEANSYRLLIEDRNTKGMLIIPIEVQAKVAGGGNGNGTPAASNAGIVKGLLEKDPVVTVNDVKVTIVLPKLNDNDKSLEVQYKVDAGKTVKAEDVVKAILARGDIKGALGGDTVTIKAGLAPADELQGAVRANTIAALWGAVVAGLSNPQIQLIQKRLCMPPAEHDGRWGTRSQTALETDRQQRRDKTQVAPATGSPLARQESSMLLSLTEDQVVARCKT